MIDNIVGVSPHHWRSHLIFLSFSLSHLIFLFLSFLPHITHGPHYLSIFVALHSMLPHPHPLLSIVATHCHTTMLSPSTSKHHCLHFPHHCHLVVKCSSNRGKPFFLLICRVIVLALFFLFFIVGAGALHISFKLIWSIKLNFRLLVGIKDLGLQLFRAWLELTWACGWFVCVTWTTHVFWHLIYCFGHWLL